MSQFEILEFLKSRPNLYFSVDDIATNLGLSVQSVFTNIKKMELELTAKQIQGKTKHMTTVYAFTTNSEMNELMAEFQILRTTPLFTFMSPETITNLIVAKEVRKLNKRIENGTK